MLKTDFDRTAALRGTRYGQALDNAARDEARRRTMQTQPDAYERMLLHRYVQQVARSGGVEAILARVGRTTESAYRLSADAWALLDEARENGTFTVGRGLGPSAKALVDRELAEQVRTGVYRLTEAGQKLVMGQKAEASS
jgi:hypothetical protein